MHINIIFSIHMLETFIRRVLDQDLTYKSMYIQFHIIIIHCHAMSESWNLKFEHCFILVLSISKSNHCHRQEISTMKDWSIVGNTLVEQNINLSWMPCCRAISTPTVVRVDKPVSEHLRTQRRLNPYTLFLCIWSLKKTCGPPPSFQHQKLAQFVKGMGKIWGVWWKGVLYSVMSELKQIKILSLKSLIIASFDCLHPLIKEVWCN
jgi:hypothetical protein